MHEEVASGAFSCEPHRSIYANTPANRPLDMFRNIQLEIAKFSRLTAGFPDLALSEADRCMVVLRNLDVEVKKYVLLHARVDSMEQLETALKFYDANLKILTFQEKDGKGVKEHANALTFDDKGKGKKGDKGKEKGKGKDKDGKNGKGKEKGKDGKGKSGKDKDSKDNRKGGAAKDSGKGSGSNKDKDKEKEERLKNIKCDNCDQYGHYSNKCPKPKREKASAAALLEPQVAAASVEPQLFAVALELGCPVVELDSEDGSDLSREDWEDFVASYECAWSEPVVLEGSELVVALEVSEPPVELESSPCDVVVLGEVPEFFEVPTRTIEPAESQEVPNRTPVELAESRDFPGRTLVELASPLEVSFSLAESEPLSFEKGRFADFQNGVELGMVHGLSCHGHGMVAHETVASASQQHDTMDWWLVDSGASAHIINQDTLSRVHVVSNREAASECISATGDSIGVRRSAVVRVPFVLVSGETVITELQVLVAPVKFNLLSLGRLLGRSWTVDFMPNFKVEAAGYSLRTRWCSNCGWIMSRGVPLSESVAESDSVAVATRVSLKPSPAGEKPERRDG